MTKKKIKSTSGYPPIPTTMTRIERWQICQKIGKKFYESKFSFEELLYLRDQGLDNIIKFN